MKIDSEVTYDSIERNDKVEFSNAWEHLKGHLPKFPKKPLPFYIECLSLQIHIL